MIDTLPHRLMGAYAYRLGIPRHENPYPLTSFDRADWADGWDEAALGVAQDGSAFSDPIVTAEMLDAGYDATRAPDGTPRFAEAGFTVGWAGVIYRAMATVAQRSAEKSMK